MRLGIARSLFYDYRFGIPLSMTSMNGQVTHYTIDDAGRISTIQAPNEVVDGVAFTIRYKYFPNAVIPWAQNRTLRPPTPYKFYRNGNIFRCFWQNFADKKRYGYL